MVNTTNNGMYDWYIPNTTLLIWLPTRPAIAQAVSVMPCILLILSIPNISESKLGRQLNPAP